MIWELLLVPLLLVPAAGWVIVWNRRRKQPGKPWWTR